MPTRAGRGRGREVIRAGDPSAGDYEDCAGPRSVGENHRVRYGGTEVRGNGRVKYRWRPHPRAPFAEAGAGHQRGAFLVQRGRSAFTGGGQGGCMLVPRRVLEL